MIKIMMMTKTCLTYIPDRWSSGPQGGFGLPATAIKSSFYNQTLIILCIGNIIINICAKAIKCCSLIKLTIFVGTRIRYLRGCS